MSAGRHGESITTEEYVEQRGRMVANLKMCYKEESGEWLLLNKAALLDPRFSRLVHLSPAQKHLVTESLSHELTETETDTDRTRQGEKSAAALGAMGSLFGDLYSTADRSSCSGNGELRDYLKETLSADRNPLSWWRDTGCHR
ncbi:unnamed protein product [Boreogadus saida]